MLLTIASGLQEWRDLTYKNYPNRDQEDRERSGSAADGELPFTLKKAKNAAKLRPLAAVLLF